MSWLEKLEGKAKAILTFIALLSAIASGLFALDARYMHAKAAEELKEANEIVHTEIQLLVFTRALKFYEKRIDGGGHVTAEEMRDYETLKSTVSKLNDKQNAAMGL